jgi:hypothetical protein
MNPLLLLGGLWAWHNRSRSSVVPSVPQPPHWPTAASPPPPQPAFQAQASAPAAEHGTPLAKLHTSPPKPPPASTAAKPQNMADQALRAARARVKVKLPGGLHLPGLSSTPSKVALVHDLQAILLRHGAKLAQDGLYGPKTASAWSSLAKRNGLPSAISRNGPKTARVAVQTLDALTTAAIP